MLSKTMALLLGIIEQQPVNAYEMDKWLSVMNIRAWYNIASSTVYASLKTAEKKGYINGNVEKSGNTPEKTVYSITESGKTELFDTIKHYLSDFEYDITPFNIGMFFIKAIETKEAVELLEKRTLLLNQYRQGLQAQIEKMEASQVPQLVVLNVRQNLYIVEAQLKGTGDIVRELRA